MSALHLFERFGVELEYMLVDRQTLDVRPITDEIIRDVTGAYVSDVNFAPIGWSNELVLHVIEIKTIEPMRFDGLSERFAENIRRINELASRRGALLMPTAMHPWMNPLTETKLWPHEYSAVYEAFDRVFGCQGHGWSNLQSTHINLPFYGDEEFGRLHAAIRLILPILPALAASSPIVEGRIAAHLDARLNYYRGNAAKLPIVSGRIIPEPAYSHRQYDEMIFQPLYRAIAPHDSEGVLQDEFLNARGAIARFSRGAIEIRVLDVQECPAADLAILQLIVAVLEDLVGERWSRLDAQQAAGIDQLEPVLLACIRDAEMTPIADASYLHYFGADTSGIATAGSLWKYLYEQVVATRPQRAMTLAPLRVIFEQGCLARRIVRAVGDRPSRETLVRVYRRLADCLSRNEMFVG